MKKRHLTRLSPLRKTKKTPKGYMCPWGGEYHTFLLFPPARELPETVQKVIWEGCKRVIVVPVRKSEKWFWSLGEIVVDRWDIPKGESILWDGKGKMLPQEGHLQYQPVRFDALGIEQEELNQTSWKQPLGDPDLREVLHLGACRPDGTTAALGLRKRPVGMKRRNWNVLALKRAKEGYGPPDLPDIDLIYPAFQKPSSHDNRNDSNRRSEVKSSSRDSPAAPTLTLNHLKKVESSISSQTVVDWILDLVGTETANCVDQRTPPQHLLYPRTRSVRSILEADAKEFSDPHLQKMVELYRKKLLDEFKDTAFNLERNNWEEIKANANKRGPEGWVKLELNEGSTTVAFSPIQAVGPRGEALKEKIQGFEKRGWIEGSKSPWVARGCRKLGNKSGGWSLIIGT